MQSLFFFISLIQLSRLIYSQQCTNYRVQKGDTCFSLGINQALNPNINCNPLVAYTQICIVSVSCDSNSTPYSIKSGDTCFSLGLSQSSFNCNNLQIGQQICIPVTSSVTCDSNSSPYTIKSGDTCFSLGIKSI